MANRLEDLRYRIDKLIRKKQPGDSLYFITHLYGVSNFCTLLAIRRGLDPEIAATCGMLHDIYQITAGTIEQHAVEGAKVAESMLREMGAYSDEEIAIITAAISRHSKKRKVHEPYDELLKDADTLSHCLYNTSYPIVEKEVKRFKALLAELGCDPLSYNNSEEPK